MGVIHAIHSYDRRSIDNDEVCTMSFTTDSKDTVFAILASIYLTARRPDACLDIILLLVTRMRRPLSCDTCMVTNHESRILFLILFCQIELVSVSKTLYVIRCPTMFCDGDHVSM